MVRTVFPWNGGGPILDAVCREMDEFVNRLQETDEGSGKATFTPRANVAETDRVYELTLDVPGMQAGDFDIQLHEGRLTVSGERPAETADEGKTLHRVERLHGTFRRTFALRHDVKQDCVEAVYRDGVLTVTVPKVDEVQPRKIEVKS